MRELIITKKMKVKWAIETVLPTSNFYGLKFEFNLMHCIMEEKYKQILKKHT